MERILKKYTTIPQHLYVERSADFQLKSIVEDMQRPGYVLVARQMGKTNLLINAKRTMEHENRLFVYVDLSNPYKDEQECFRSIINNIIEFNFEIFENIYSKIQEIRAKNLPPHNEYLRSLVIILKHYIGDLIIILDEIDALKSAEYSDNIFAQIRSNYFSRTNFIELERLTYILSGVIEPTELIKDKNKSPFNIGDKIYLDDFTKEEHTTFIYKSKLRISKEISQELFEWTNGNPRLTFDICSELETIILNGTDVNSEILSEVIQRKYLTAFDLAPIDHIRELVKENKFIRDAIKNIYSNKSDLLNDDIKSKLYLFGIINARFDEKTRIKNKIISEALNEDWIRSLDNDKTFFSAISKFSEDNYEDTIDILKYVLEESNEKNEIEKAHYYIGLSYYNLDDFKNAIKHFTFNYQIQSIKNDANAFYGVSLLKLDDKKGLQILEEVISIENNNHPYHFALLNLAINTVDKEKALKLLTKLVESTYKSNDNIDGLNEMRALSYFYKSNIYEFQEDIIKAIEMLNKSLEFSNVEDRPILLYYNLLLKNKLQISNIEDKINIVNSIINSKLRFSNKSTYPLNLNIEGFIEILNSIFDKTDNKPFLSLVDYISNQLFKNTKKCVDLIINTSKISPNNSIDMLKITLENFEVELSLSQLIEIHRLLIDYEKDDTKYSINFNRYFNLLKENVSYDLNEDDVNTTTNAIQRFFTSKLPNKSIEICNFLEERIKRSTDAKVLPFLSLVYFWKANVFFVLQNKNESLKYGNETIKLAEQLEKSNDKTIDPASLKSMKQLMNELIFRTRITPSPSSTKSLKNQTITVQYLNGKVTKGRLKHFERDLSTGKCIVVNNT